MLFGAIVQAIVDAIERCAQVSGHGRIKSTPSWQIVRFEWSYFPPGKGGSPGMVSASPLISGMVTV